MSLLFSSAVELHALRAVAEVLPGFSTGTGLKHDPEGTHQVVMSKHLKPGLPYVYTDGDDFRINPSEPAYRSAPTRPSGHRITETTQARRQLNRTRSVDRYELQRGDVLFMSRGTRNVATRLESIPFPSIAPVSFYIVRPRSSEGLLPGLAIAFVEPTYLAWFLNSPFAQRAIDDIRTGAGTPLVQRSALLDLGIPVPDLQLQREIGVLGELMAQERILREELTSAATRANDATTDSIARSLFERSVRTTDKRS